MKTHLIISLSLALAACEGARRPPYVGGEGILVEGQAVRVDPAKVPLLDTCTTGQLVQRTWDTGWACASAELGTLADRLDAVERDQGARLEALSRRSSELESRLTELESAHAALETELSALESGLAEQRGAVYAVAAVTCLPAGENIAADLVSSTGGHVAHKAGLTGAIELYCPVIGTSTAPAWNRFALDYTDPDGSASGARVRAELRSVANDGRVETLASLDSNSSTQTAAAELETPLTDGFDFAARHYFVHITLERTGAGLQPEVTGVRLRR